MNTFSANFARLMEYRDRLNKLQKGLWHEAAVFSELDLPEPEEIGGIYEEICGNTDSIGTLSDLALFCSAFSEVYRNRFSDVFTDGDTGHDREIPRIAYLQNTFSDRAYRVFSGEHTRNHPGQQVSAAYFPGFREVCEEVYYGRCTHAMLPVSSSREGLLPSFRKLIAKYELKIISETDVDMGDESTMRFALLRHGLNTVGKYGFADLTVVLTETISLGSFLEACQLLGSIPVTVNTYPLEYADDRWGIHITFDVSGGDPNALYLFLEISHISYEAVGLYDLLTP